MSVKACECGCGRPAPISKQTYRKRGIERGQPQRFVRGHSRRRIGNHCGRGHDVRVRGIGAGGECLACRRVSERHTHWRKVVGIDFTIEQYDALLQKQGGGCAVCHRPPSPNKCLDVDHDHSTGRVRGLLCNLCNWLVERVALFSAAEAYLRQGE